MRQRGNSPKSGFTLIELMLVSAIIGLLAAIALPKFANMIDKSREAAFKGSMGALRSALSIYYADNEGIYPRYWALPPRSYGMYYLHDKYINLNLLRFHLPSYIDWWGVRSFTGMQLYSPTGGGYYALLNIGSNDVIPYFIHSAAPLPSYWCWNASAATVSRGHIATYGVGSGGQTLMDTKGEYWSNW